MANQSKDRRDPSGGQRNVDRVKDPTHDEASFEQVALVELSLEKTRARTQRAATALRELGAEPHLVEALERVQEELSANSRQLRQSTYFAVPSGQTTIEAA